MDFADEDPEAQPRRSTKALAHTDGSQSQDLMESRQHKAHGIDGDAPQILRGRRGPSVGGWKLEENDKEEEERQEEMGRRKTQGTMGLKKDTKAWDFGTHAAGLSHI